MSERTGREPQISSESSPVWLYRRAREYFVSGQRELAEDYAQRVLAIQPQHEGSQHMLAAIDRAKQQEEAAREEELRRQWVDIVSRQRQAEECFTHGLQLLANHQRIEAANAFREAVRLDPEHGAAREYVETFDQQAARERQEAAQAIPEAVTVREPASPPGKAPRRKTPPLIALLLALAISVGVTYGIVRLFGTIIPTLDNGLPLALIFCGWVFFPLFILMLGALNPKHE